MREASDKEFKQTLAKLLRNEVVPKLSEQEKQKMIYVPDEGYKTMDVFYKDIIDRLENKDHDETQLQFPYIEGELAEMFVDGEWVKGRIVNGYRFRDGVVTIETNDGKRYWCGQDRTELYRPFKEVSTDGAEENS